MDKQLVDNVLKHTTTHNRVVEEEACWRQILQQRKQRATLQSGSESGSDRWSGRNRSTNERHNSRSPVSEASWKNSSQRSTNSGKIATSAKQQALDAYERELRHQAKREIELAASQKVPGVSVPNVTMNDRWGHDGWEALQDNNAREPTPAYRPRIQPASYRLAPLVSRTIENPIRAESLSSDPSQRSSSVPAKDKRRRKSKKRNRRRRGDADSDTDDSRSRSRSRSASSDASKDDEDGGGNNGDKRSKKKKKSRKKRRKEKKRRSKRYSKRRGRKSRRRRRYDSSSCSRSSSRSRSSRSVSSRSRTRRTTSFSSYTSAGSRSRRSSCSCSGCDSRNGSFSTSRSRSGSSSRSSSSSRSRSRTGGRRSRSRNRSASSFDSQRAFVASRAVRHSREPTAENKPLPRELTDDGRSSERTVTTLGRPDNRSPIQPLNEYDIPLPDGVGRGPLSVSPVQFTEPVVVRYGGPEFESPGVASSSSLPRKPVSPTLSSRSPNAVELQSPREAVPLPCDPILPGELDDLYDPLLAVNDTPSHSPKSSEAGRAGHSDADACEIVDHDSDIAVETPFGTPRAPSPPISPQRRADAPWNTAPQRMVCPSPFSIPLPSSRPNEPTGAAVDLDFREEDAIVVRLCDIVPPPMPRVKEEKPKQQEQPKTLTVDCYGSVEEVPLDSICIPPTPPSTPSREVSISKPTLPPSVPSAANKQPRDIRSGSRYDTLSSDLSMSLPVTKFNGNTAPTSEDKRVGVQSRENAAVEGGLKRLRRDYSPKSSSDSSASPSVDERQRSKRNARYGDSQDDSDRRETGGYPADSIAPSFERRPQPQQPNQTTAQLSVLVDNTSKQNRRKSREEQPVDQVVSSKPVAQTEERVAMLPPAVKKTPAYVSDVHKQDQVVSNAKYESQEEGEILSPFEEVTFKRRKRKHGKYHSSQREEPPAFAMTISPFKLPSRQFLARNKQHSEPYVQVKQASSTPAPPPVKPKKKSRDRQHHNKADRASSEEPVLESDWRERGRHRSRRRDRHAVVPMDDLPVAPACSLVEQPIEKVSRWQEHVVAAPHPSTAHSRSVAQPAVTSSLAHFGLPVASSLVPPAKQQQLQERDSSTKVKISTAAKPASVENEYGAVNSRQSSVSNRKTKNKKGKKEKKEIRKEKRKHQPEVTAEPLPETVSSRKRSKREEKIRFTEALEAFTQHLLDTKRALLPFQNLNQMTYGTAAMAAPEHQGKRRSRKHPPQPLSTYPIPEVHLPQAKPRSKKRNTRESKLNAEHPLVSDPHILDEQLHSYLEETLLNAGKDRHKHMAQQVQQPDRSVKQTLQDSDSSTSDTTSDSESSTDSSNNSSDGHSSSNSSDSCEEEQTVAPAPIPASRKHRHHHQPVPPYINGSTQGHHKMAAKEPKVSLRQPHEPEGGRRQKTKKQKQYLKDEVNSSRRHMEDQTRIQTSTTSHQSLSARKRPPPPSTASSSESSDSSAGASSSQSDEETAWK